MLRLVSDEDVDGRLIDGLLARQPDLDLVRVQDVGLRTREDPVILEWAATEGRIVLTHDRGTMPYHAEERIKAGEKMPGMFVLRDGFSLGKLIEEVLVRVQCSEQEEWNFLIDYLP